MLRRGLWLVLPLSTLACTARDDSGASPPHADAGSSEDSAEQFEDAAVEDAALDDTGEPPAPPRGLARNIIVFMGDGMGPEQLSTARYAKHGALRYDELAGPAYVSTDSLTTASAVDPEQAPTDSAAAASAIATGVRVENGWLSLTGAGEAPETVLEACKKVGKATGLVTTSTFYDASPAAFAVHQDTRDATDAIIRQMLGETQPDVIMGNGARVFDDSTRGLHADAEAAGYLVLRGVAELAAWDAASDTRTLGLFGTDFVAQAVASEDYSMTPALERREDSPDPTLATMTERALARLGRAPEGFFLFVEDELIDEMGHRGPAEVEWVNRAYPAQVAALDDALGVAIDWVHAHSSFEDTLIVLLADHETGGYHYDHALGPSSGQFSAVVDTGEYLSGNHTRAKTAVFARGPGSEVIGELREHADTHWMLIGAP